MKSQKVTLTNTQGQNLSALLDLPIDQKPSAYAIFAHCFTCSKNLNAVRNISLALTKNGIGVLRFDFTGLGNSEGEFADTNFSSNVKDLIVAADYLKDNFESPKLLIGHSLGGAAVLVAAHQLDSIEAVATIGAPASPKHVEHLFHRGIDEIQEKGSAEVSLGGRKFKIKKEFITDLAIHEMPKSVHKLNKSLLFLHSPQDTTVGIENAAALYKEAMHPKSFISLDGASHLLEKEEDSLYTGDVIASWAQRYIDIKETSDLRTNEDVVTQIGSEGYTTDILAGDHHLRADEPVDVGGNNFGPSPYDLLLSGLGACTAMTMRMYADRKKWPIESVRVHLSHSKKYKDDVSNPSQGNAKIDFIKREIEINGELDETQRARLMEIADKCPVHRTLHNEIKVESVLV